MAGLLAGCDTAVPPTAGLSGRRMVITGAGRGLGRALAITAADMGADLVLLARSTAVLDSLAPIIRARSGRSVDCFRCDLGDPSSVAEACRQVLDAGPVVDVLINNGAPWLLGRIEDLADADISNAVAAAVTGTILLTKGLLPGLRKSDGADIVTIVSTAGLLGHDSGESSVAFHAAKHGQSGLSERLRAELRTYGIRVAAIYPPEFDDTDPLQPDWNEVRSPAAGAKLTNREVVATVMFAINAPRVCSYPIIVLDNLSRV